MTRRPTSVSPGDARGRLHVRWRAVRRLEHWLQLLAFCAVGASGFVVNLAVFTAMHLALGLHHLVAASLAFAAALVNNFCWHRRWTFSAYGGRLDIQAARFLLVSLLAFVIATGSLAVLVHVLEVPAVAAQAIAVATATPFNFIANKLWSFRPQQHPSRPEAAA